MRPSRQGNKVGPGQFTSGNPNYPAPQVGDNLTVYTASVLKTLVPHAPDEWQDCQDHTDAGSGDPALFAALAEYPPTTTAGTDGGTTWNSTATHFFGWGSFRYRIGLFWSPWQRAWAFGA